MDVARPEYLATPTVPRSDGRILRDTEQGVISRVGRLTMNVILLQKPAGSNSSYQPRQIVVDRRKLHNHLLSRTLRAAQPRG